MKEQINKIKLEIENFVAKDKASLDEYRHRFIGKKGVIKQLNDYLKELPNEEKKQFGQTLNQIKTLAKQKLELLTEEIGMNPSSTSSFQDITIPSFANLGNRHPLSKVAYLMIKIFNNIGFNLADGPEIEDDWHNFTALNIPLNHPARDMQDTFFIAPPTHLKNQKDTEEDYLLRTQTSSIQIRTLETTPPPIRTVSIGRVYRNEAISARSNCIFHQMEALYVNTDVSFKDLKQTIFYFCKEIFGHDINIRFRPSFFPFTEPSAEIDISCQICSGKGCKICKYTGWLEIGGSGMVDPNVLTNCNVSSDKYSGFAIGMGLERIAMLKYKIDDLRLFVENNVEFLQQFSTYL